MILSTTERLMAYAADLRHALRAGWLHGDDHGARCNFCSEVATHDPSTKGYVCAHTPECLMTTRASLVGDVNDGEEPSNMEASYHGGRGYVPAAALDALEPAGAALTTTSQEFTDARAQLEGAREDRERLDGAVEAYDQRLADERAALMNDLRFAEATGRAAIAERDALATRLDGAVKALEAAALEAHAFANHIGSLEACHHLNCSRARAALALARGTT